MKVLVIPHAPRGHYRIRSLELAGAFAPKVETLYLDWKLPDASSRFGLVRMARRALDRRAARRKPVETSQGPGGVRLVTGPFVVTGRPEDIWAHNREALARTAEALGVTHVLSASAMQFPCDALAVERHVYDLVDDHADLCSARNRPSVERFISEQVAAADAVAVVSGQLQDVVRSRWGRESTVIPNGAHAELLMDRDDDATTALRASLGLEGKRVIGYIGNHGSWSGVTRLVEAFSALRASRDDAALVIVGPGAEADRLASRPLPPGVTLTGPVPPAEVHRYFQAIDLGVLPFDVCPFTDNAMPLKVVEYGFARKIVVASRLKELERLALPHVRFAPPEPQAWAAALGEALEEQWSDDWLAPLEPFRWESLGGRMLALLRGEGSVSP